MILMYCYGSSFHASSFRLAAATPSSSSVPSSTSEKVNNNNNKKKMFYFILCLGIHFELYNIQKHFFYFYSYCSKCYA